MRLKQSFWTLLLLMISRIVCCQNQDDLNSFISSQYDYLISNGEIKSISVGIVKNGKVYKFQNGQFADGKSPNDQTLYEIASLTKTFTGTLLAKAILDK